MRLCLMVVGCGSMGDKVARGEERGASGRGQ